MSYYNGPKIITDGLILYLDAKRLNSSNYSTFWTDLTSTYTINKSSPNYYAPKTNYLDGTYTFFGGGGFNTSFSWPSNFTVCMILRSYELPDNTYARIISTGPSNNFEFAIANVSSQLSPRFYPNASNAWDTMTSAQYLQAGKFYHLTLVKSGSNFLFYINGAFSYGGTTNASAGTSFHYGRSIANAEYSSTTLSNFSIYNRALSSMEIVQNYGAMLPRLSGPFVQNGTTLYVNCGEEADCYRTFVLTDGAGAVSLSTSWGGQLYCGGGCPLNEP